MEFICPARPSAKYPTPNREQARKALLILCLSEEMEHGLSISSGYIRVADTVHSDLSLSENLVLDYPAPPASSKQQVQEHYRSRLGTALTFYVGLHCSLQTKGDVGKAQHNQKALVLLGSCLKGLLISSFSTCLFKHQGTVLDRKAGTNLIIHTQRKGKEFSSSDTALRNKGDSFLMLRRV